MTHKQTIETARKALADFWPSLGEHEIGTGARTWGNPDSHQSEDLNRRLYKLGGISMLAADVAATVFYNAPTMSANVGVEISAEALQLYFRRVRQQMGDAILDVLLKNEP